jgi:F420-dependent oxidoreductase-like protein
VTVLAGAEPKRAAPAGRARRQLLDRLVASGYTGDPEPHDSDETREDMQLGIHIVSFDYPGGAPAIAPTLARVGRAAEAIGASHLSVMDHWFQMDQMAPAEDPMLEGYTTLGYLAAHTTTITLGLLVTGVTYRHPGLLAKIIATLDVLSGGRAQLGIGAAWYEREHRGLGVPYPPVSERFERLEETLQICQQMWNADDNGSFDGPHYQLAETLCSPQPISQPRPSILIGGSGERKTLRLVARYADACNIFASSADVVAHKLDVLRSHCADVGRDPSSVRKTILHVQPTLATGDIDGFLTEMEAYAAIGIEEVIVMPSSDRPDRWIENVCGSVTPRLAELSVDA